MMWDFIKVLLFSAMISITGGKKDFAPGDYQFGFREPLVAINEGASVYVDVSSMLPHGQTLAMKREWASRFPSKSMTIRLIPKDNSEEPVRFTYRGGISYAEDALYLILVSDRSVPPSVEYKAAEFKTTIRLDDVELLWKNYGK